MAVLLATEAITNGTRAKKRTITETDVINQDSPRIKRARKDSHENFPNSGTPGLSFQHEATLPSDNILLKQKTLLLHRKKQPYTLTHSYPVPKANEGSDELLIKVQIIGLNPIDWKAPDFGFGIPKLPYIAGRDLVGIVASEPPTQTSSSRLLRKGDIVFSASTDYRDLRKAAYQEYAIASLSNVCRVPLNVRRQSVAGLGVAFVAAVLTVGVCFGVDFSALDESIRGPNLKKILKDIPTQSIPKDVQEECLKVIEQSQQPKAGDWVAIWGGSSATALIIAQLSKLLGLRVIKIVDVGKHGMSLSQGPADLLVDCHDANRAIDIVQRVTQNKLRFAVDTVGKPTAELLRKTLRYGNDDSKYEDTEPSSHLVGLTGLPKIPLPGIQQHTVPIKIHHEVPEIGEALMQWLEVLLQEGKIIPPEIEVLNGGLASVNDGLDRMRRGEISGRRLAVSLA